MHVSDKSPISTDTPFVLKCTKPLKSIDAMTQYMIEPHIDQINFSSRKQRNECLCFIIPGHMLQHIVRNTDDEELRESTFNTLALSEQARGRRQILGAIQ